MSFQVGDVVQLKSGGPQMVVTYVGERGDCRCDWFVQDTSVQNYNFPPQALEPVIELQK